jgi:3-oxoacyl-[acyl-carrier protein] reductase
MDLHLTGRGFVVTGGTSGLGRATAQTLVDEGADVLVAARTEESVRSTVSDLDGSTGSAHGVVADVGDPAAADLLVEEALARLGRVDGALVSVGGPPAGSVMETSDDDWRAAFDSVFLGAVRLSRRLVSAMPDGGSLVLVLSTSVKAPIDGLAISNGLRPGLGMVVKMLADEVGGDGIRVNGLMPGRVETDRVRELDSLADDPAARRAAHEQAIALGRYGRPEEFGRVATFLLSPASSYITGSMIPVDGGLTRAL